MSRRSVEDDGVVMGDLALLHSAIENVVRNAMRYTMQGSEVQVHLRCDQQPGRTAGDNSGQRQWPGVPEEALDKFFRPFYRIDDARGRQTGGVGLGLSITERAVRLHGGVVRATNRPEGGLQIEIRLPMERQSDKSSNAVQTRSSLAKPIRPVRPLLTADRRQSVRLDVCSFRHFPDTQVDTPNSLSSRIRRGVCVPDSWRTQGEAMRTSFRGVVRALVLGLLASWWVAAATAAVRTRVLDFLLVTSQG